MERITRPYNPLTSTPDSSYTGVRRMPEIPLPPAVEAASDRLARAAGLGPAGSVITPEGRPDFDTLSDRSRPATPEELRETVLGKIKLQQGLEQQGITLNRDVRDFKKELLQLQRFADNGVEAEEARAVFGVVREWSDMAVRDESPQEGRDTPEQYVEKVRKEIALTKQLMEWGMRVDIPLERRATMLHRIATTTAYPQELREQAEKSVVALRTLREQVASRSGFWQQLNLDDFNDLSKGENDQQRMVALEEFANRQFDRLYEAVGVGRDPTESPVFRGVEQAFQEAVRYLGATTGNRTSLVEHLADIFDTRISLMGTASAVSMKNMEYMQKSAAHLKDRGLLLAYTFKRVPEFFSRMCEMVEDKRVTLPYGHLTPEYMATLQKSLIDEAMALAGQGIGIYAGMDEKAIRRNVVTAGNLFLVTQRLHVIASWQEPLPGIQAFLSDVGSAFPGMNILSFLTDKWGLLTATTQEYFQEIQNRLAQDYIDEKREHDPSYKISEQQRLILGRLLLINIANAPDFFSSGWRIDGITIKLGEFFTLKTENAEEGQKIAKDFALFLRLKKGDEDRTEVWKKIAEYYPEEMIHIIRARYSEKEMAGINKRVFGDGNYDTFKQQYGGLISAIRGQGFSNNGLTAGRPEQLNFANLSSDQINAVLGLIPQPQLIEEAGTEAEIQAIRARNQENHVVYIQKQTALKQQLDDMQKIFTNMQLYIREANVVKTIYDKDTRFVNLYERTLRVDDCLLGLLENNKEYKDELVSLSEFYAADIGGNSLLRNFKDHGNDTTGKTAFIGSGSAIGEEEKTKAANESAEAIAAVNGPGGRAKIIYALMMPYLEMSMIPVAADVLGIDKSPFRRKALRLTRLEKWAGNHMRGKSQTERLEAFDKLEVKLEEAVSNDIRMVRLMSLEELEKKAFALVERKPGTKKLNRHEKKEKSKVKSKLNHLSSDEDTRITQLQDILIAKINHNSEKRVAKAKRILHITDGDLFKQKLNEMFFIMIFAALGEAFGLTEDAIEEVIK